MIGQLIKPKRLLVSIVTLAIILLSPMAEGSTPLPPETAKIPVFDTLHGVVIEDSYRWLEDQYSPETRAWIDAQNKYTRSFFPQFRRTEWAEKRLYELLQVDQFELPYECNGRFFLRKRPSGNEQYIIYARDGLNGPDRVLLDPAVRFDAPSLSVEIGDISADGRLLGYMIRQGGEDETAVRFLEVESGTELADSLPRALHFSLSINADNTGFYYVRADSTGSRVYYHAFGTDISEDPMLFGEQYGPNEYIDAYLSDDRQFLTISVYHGSSGGKTEVFVMNTDGEGQIVPVVTDTDARFYAFTVDEKMFLMTNHNAPNWCVYLVDVTNPSFDNWKLIIPEDTGAVIDDFAAASGRLYVTYLESVCPHVKIFDEDGGNMGELKLPALGTVGDIQGPWQGKEIFLKFSSYSMPETIYRIDRETAKMEAWSRSEVEIDSDKIVVKQVWYTSRDGTKVPMWLAHGKDVALDGNNHTYLTGYGGFNIGVTPKFRATYAIWIESGGVLAVPCLRGGNEFGEPWHRAAMFENKQNTFDDFIAAAEWLIESKYTSPEKLAIRGGSNGGLLVGAVMNQRPDLCQAVICTYPLLDMVRYHKFLMGPYWVSEYGSADNPEHFEFICKYSPYHNVVEGTDYPAVMYVTGDGDTRVAPLHARKMTALMQAKTGSENPVLLYYDTEAGHAGDMAVSKDVEEASAQLGFLFWQLGVEP